MFVGRQWLCMLIWKDEVLVGEMSEANSEKSQVFSLHEEIHIRQ